MRMSSRVTGRSTPSRSTQVGVSARTRSTNALMARASSGEQFLVAGMGDRQVAEARSPQRGAAFDADALQPGPGRQLPFVEELRRKRADIRMRSPGFPQEQALVGGDRLLAVKDV